MMHLRSMLCSLVFNLFADVHSELVVTPSNTVILEHKPLSSIDMACKSDYQIRLKWKVRENGDSENDVHVFYNGYYLREDATAYSAAITDESGKCYLRFRNIAEVAKTYICVEPGSLQNASADLTWINGEPVCINNSVEDLINLTCSIEFRGNWAPTMEWKEYNSDDEKFLSVGVNTITVPNERVTSALVIPVQNGSRNYTCTTKFDIRGKPNSTTATNVPDYYKVWTAPLLPKTKDVNVEGKPTNEIEDVNVEGKPTNAIEDKNHTFMLTIMIGTICSFAGVCLIIAIVVICVINRLRVENENRNHTCKPIIEDETDLKVPTPQMENGLPDSRTFLISRTLHT